MLLPINPVVSGWTSTGSNKFSVVWGQSSKRNLTILEPPTSTAKLKNGVSLEVVACTGGRYIRRVLTGRWNSNPILLPATNTDGGIHLLRPVLWLERLLVWDRIFQFPFDGKTVGRPYSRVPLYWPPKAQAAPPQQVTVSRIHGTCIHEGAYGNIKENREKINVGRTGIVKLV